MAFNNWGFTNYVKTVMYTMFALYAFLLLSSFGLDSLYSGSVVSSQFILDNMSMILLALSVVYIVILVTLYFNALGEIKKLYDIGKRKQDECGMEYVEAETGNYALYKFFNARSSLTDYLKAMMWVLLVLNLGIICRKDVALTFWNMCLKANSNFWKLPLQQSLFTTLTLSLVAIVGIAISVFVTNLQVVSKLKDMYDISVYTNNTSKLYDTITFKFIQVCVAVFALMVIIQFYNPDPKPYVQIGLFYSFIVIAWVTYNICNRDLLALKEAVSMYKSCTAEEGMTCNINKTQSSSLSQSINKIGEDKVLATVVDNYKRITNEQGDASYLQDKIDDKWAYILHKNGKELDEVD